MRNLNRRSFMKHTTAIPLGLSAAMPLLGQLPVSVSATAADTPKAPLNILLLLTDDQSAHLECLGTQGIHTPCTTALAEEGVLFVNAFATAASCAPARSGLLTGMAPHSNGHWRNTNAPRINSPDVDFTRQGRFARIEQVGVHEDIPTLVEILNARGYETAITEKLHLSPPWKYPFRQRFRAGLEVDDNERAAARFFRGCGDKPFFLMANILHPHRPFRRHIVKTDYSPVDPNRIDVPANLPDTPDIRRDLADYFETVQSADACAAAILKALKASGKYDNTLIIFTSDQGYCYHRAKATAYDLGIRVPLIMAGPTVRKNHFSRQLVSHIDLMPTILDMLSLSIPGTVEGKSLRPLLSDGQNAPWRDIVFAEHNSHGPSPHEYYPIRSAFDGRFHYLRNLLYDQKRWTGDMESLLKNDTFPNELLFAGPTDAFQRRSWDNRSFEATIRAKEQFPDQYALLQKTFARPHEELYDLHTDPFEMRNLADDERFKKQLLVLRQAVTQWMKDTNDPGIELNRTPRRTS